MARPVMLGRLVRACAGPDVRRPWLLEIELWCYLVLAALLGLRVARAPDLSARAGTPQFWAAGAVAVAVVAVTLARWWRPERAVALTAITFGLACAHGLAQAFGVGLGGIPIALALYGAVPVAFAALVRRARPALVALVVVLALARIVHGLARSSQFTLEPPAFRGAGQALQFTQLFVIVVEITLAWLLPLVVGLVLRGTDARRRAAALVRVRATERVLLARELHDLVANHVTGIVTYAQAAGLRSDVPGELRGMLDAIETAGDDALAGMRRMVGALRDVDDQVLGTLDVMPTTATDLRGAVRSAVGDDDGAVRTRTCVAPELESSPVAPPADVLATVHRLVVEALTNVRRHAPHADEVVVVLDLPCPDVLRVEIRNDGAGRPSREGRRRGGGFGIVGLRERVGILGGTLQHGRSGEDHWVLRAELPWPGPSLEAGQ